MNDLEPGMLIASIMVSLIGFACFSYGKKQKRPPALVIGAVTMAVPYFLSTATMLLLTCGALLAALWFSTRKLGL